jgi:hypothetical protein
MKNDINHFSLLRSNVRKRGIYMLYNMKLLIMQVRKCKIKLG